MKKKAIFPVSVLEQSANQIFREKFRLSGVLYLITLLSVMGTILAMVFIKVDVTIKASGLIKPREEHTVLKAPINGYVQTYNLSSNSLVHVGDTLLAIRSDLVSVKLPALEKRKAELESLITDLSALTTNDPINVRLSSPMYRQDVLYFLAQWNEADAKRQMTRQVYERSKKLYEANVIPLTEYEPVELEYTQAENAIRTLSDYQKRQWQSDLTAYENELRDVETQISQIEIQTKESFIQSPINGTIQSAQTLFDGSYVTAGQQILEISPDGDLIAECYILPKDIGYVKPDMRGQLQVSAFNYTEWGMLPVRVADVFDDVTVAPDGTRSYYKIHCELATDHLRLKNGYVGYMKKGMVVNGIFTVTRRTLFQLLYDKLDSWLNPYTNSNDESGN